ncbi:homoserine dehydrogenase family protein [Flavobacterium caeni]|uniref:homoserine dehydrogenase n=1 Tax=Flavobacterium caeni TaxID=490189 RepID=A0A1G5JSH1_9FLAO|nr:aspartate kinase [Flavobacterium caeni]SCY91345.1 homoserine dehydrogenase [Flavobacterium caeni]
MSLRINIVLFGIGNVGSTLLAQAIESQNFFRQRYGIDLRFPVITNSTVAFFEKDGNPNQWEVNFERSAVPFSVDDIIDYVKTQQLENLVAVDATASAELVRSYLPLVQNGFHLVAASKIANTLHGEFYDQLRKTLAKFDRQFLYRTNVGAGLPVINTLADLHRVGEKITQIRGVFSGSLSYIFNRFGREDLSFSQILQAAEKAGYTEPDSREDLSGNDVARKLLVLARELGLSIEWNDISIHSLLLPDLNEKNSKQEYAIGKELLDGPYRIAKLTQTDGHVLRYIGQLDVASKKLEVKLVSEPESSPLGRLTGADNLVEIYTESYGQNPIVVQGAGAGKAVTARGVLSDILKIAESVKRTEAVWNKATV